MKIIETELLDCYIIEPDRYVDDRGMFSPYFILEELKKKNIPFAEVVQCNRSVSNKGVLRGLHFQKDPKSQAKIVECIRGKVLDVAVDLRKNSKTYGKWIKVLLTSDNNRQLFLPRGFAHGFVSLEDNTIFQYIVDNDYSKSDEGGIIWCDDFLKIDWNLQEYGIDKPILSSKDEKHLCLKEQSLEFVRED